MLGKTLPVPLNVPNAGAVSEALLKGLLAQVLGKIVPNSIGKALSAELAGINIATQITMTDLSATMDVSVDVSVCSACPTMNAIGTPFGCGGTQRARRIWKPRTNQCRKRSPPVVSI